MVGTLQQNGTLTASTVRTFTFTNDTATQVLIFNNQSGAVDAWATLDGTTPTVAGANEIYVPSGAVVTEPLTRAQSGGSGAAVSVAVKVISTGTPKIVVELR